MAKETAAKRKTANHAKRAAVTRRPSSRRAAEEAEIAGVRVTHPDRVLFAGQGVTKRQLAEYYLAIAERMLPHVAGRPLALVRCPRGSGKQCFFQKHANPGWPDAFRHVRIREKSGADDYLYIEDERGLVAACSAQNRAALGASSYGTPLSARWARPAKGVGLRGWVVPGFTLQASLM